MRGERREPEPCASPAFSNNSVTAASGPGGNEGEGATIGANGAAARGEGAGRVPGEGDQHLAHLPSPAGRDRLPSPRSATHPATRSGNPSPSPSPSAPRQALSPISSSIGLPLTFVPSDAVRVLSTTKVAPFTLPAGASKTFSFQLNPLEPAAATAITSVSGQLNGATVTAQDRGAFSVIGTGPLLVALTVDPGKIKVQQTADGVDPIEATVTAAVTNTTNKRIDAVTIDKSCRSPCSTTTTSLPCR